MMAMAKITINVPGVLEVHQCPWCSEWYSKSCEDIAHDNYGQAYVAMSCPYCTVDHLITLLRKAGE